jgi:hypothetical protein
MFTIEDQTLLAIGVLTMDGRTAYTVAADSQFHVVTDSGHAVLANITLASPPKKLRLLLRRIDDHNSTAEITWNDAGLHIHQMY